MHWQEQQMPSGVVGSGLPVMAPVDTGAGGVGITDVGLGDILSVSQSPGFTIHRKNGLFHGVE